MLWRGTDGQSRSHLASQEQVTAAVAHAVEQQMQKLLEETQLDMNEFDNLLQPIIDTCTKDAISVRAGGLSAANRWEPAEACLVWGSCRGALSATALPS